jgi:uncharacterized membrane protein YfcA
MLDPLTLVALGGVGLLGGFVDAVAGGGGMLTVPALLSAGLPPIAALATNKMQSVIGTTMATYTYWRRGFVSFKALIPSIAVTYAGSLIGALTVKQIDTTFLNLAVPVALIGVALYFLFAPNLSDADRTSRLAFPKWVPLLGFVLLFGLGVTRAAGNTKLLNLTSNLAALTIFIPSGDVVWPAVMCMAVGQIIGGYIGAHASIRFGAKLIRPLVVVISIAMAIKLIVWP